MQLRVVLRCFAGGVGCAIGDVVEVQEPAAEQLIAAGKAVPVPTTWPLTANYTATNLDSIILGDTTAGSFTVKLPPSPSAGQCINVKKVSNDTNLLTIDGNGKTIEGAATFALSRKCILPWTLDPNPPHSKIYGLASDYDGTPFHDVIDGPTFLSLQYDAVSGQWHTLFPTQYFF